MSSLRGGTFSSEPGRCPERSTLAVTLRLRRAVTLRTGAFLLLILSAWPSALWADSSSVTRVLFGPEAFVRTAGPPDTVERTVTVPPSASAPLTLHLINGKWGVTAETALLLAERFKTTPELWMNLQNAWDLHEAAQILKSASA